MLSTMNCNNLNAGGLFECCLVSAGVLGARLILTRLALAYDVSGVLCPKLFLCMVS